MSTNERAIKMIAKVIGDWGSEVTQGAPIDSQDPEVALALATYVVSKLELDTEAHAVKGPVYRGYTKIVRLVGPWFEP